MAFEAEKAIARQLMQRIIDLVESRVHFARLSDLRAALVGLGFTPISEQPYGPAGGRQLFFGCGRVVVRIKTKGDAGGPRANQPHLSVSLTDGNGLNWINDLGKFNARGEIAAKSLTSADRFNPTDFQGNPQRFVVIMGGQYDGPGGDAWANRTHFNFPANFVDDV